VARSGAGYSPEFEAREAARWGNYTWPAFCAMDGEEQSAAVAHYRTHHQLEAVMADIEMKRAKAQQSKKGAK
jgi:hypothetical protein